MENIWDMYIYINKYMSSRFWVPHLPNPSTMGISWYIYIYTYNWELMGYNSINHGDFSVFTMINNGMCHPPVWRLSGAKRREFSGMIHFITSNNHPSNPQQPIHSLLSTSKSCNHSEVFFPNARFVNTFQHCLRQFCWMSSSINPSTCSFVGRYTIEIYMTHNTLW